MAGCIDLPFAALCSDATSVPVCCSPPDVNQDSRCSDYPVTDVNLPLSTFGHPSPMIQSHGSVHQTMASLFIPLAPTLRVLSWVALRSFAKVCDSLVHKDCVYRYCHGKIRSFVLFRGGLCPSQYSCFYYLIYSFFYFIYLYLNN